MINDVLQHGVAELVDILLTLRRTAEQAAVFQIGQLGRQVILRLTGIDLQQAGGKGVAQDGRFLQAALQGFRQAVKARQHQVGQGAGDLFHQLPGLAGGYQPVILPDQAAVIEQDTHQLLGVIRVTTGAAGNNSFERLGPAGIFDHQAVDQLAGGLIGQGMDLDLQRQR